ncbi:MAG TPA: hypothetical protein V6C91_06470 [Coleofasciculaceae cyanobacterium]
MTQSQFKNRPHPHTAMNLLQECCRNYTFNNQLTADATQVQSFAELPNALS